MAYNFTILTSQSQPVQYRLLWQGLSKKTDKQHNYDLGYVLVTLDYFPYQPT